jgi:hypothetical protein
VSNIPSAAVSQALTPLARATHEAARARQVQSRKNFHHTEDVEELDDTAVNSVRDDAQKRQNKDSEGRQRQDTGPEEHLDLQSLPVRPRTRAAPPMAPPTTHLDISA